MHQEAVKQGVEKIIKGKGMFVTLTCSSCWKQARAKLMAERSLIMSGYAAKSLLDD